MIPLSKEAKKLHKLISEKLRFPNEKFTPWDVRGWKMPGRPVIVEELALLHHLLSELEEEKYIELTPRAKFYQGKHEYFLTRKK